jgi:hypothetical protein
LAAAWRKIDLAVPSAISRWFGIGVRRPSSEKTSGPPVLRNDTNSSFAPLAASRSILMRVSSLHERLV